MVWREKFCTHGQVVAADEHGFYERSQLLEEVIVVDLPSPPRSLPMNKCDLDALFACLPALQVSSVIIISGGQDFCQNRCTSG